jgi:hypothetical protein
MCVIFYKMSTLLFFYLIFVSTRRHKKFHAITLRSINNIYYIICSLLENKYFPHHLSQTTNIIKPNNTYIMSEPRDFQLVKKALENRCRLLIEYSNINYFSTKFPHKTYKPQEKLLETYGWIPNIFTELSAQFGYSL